MELPNLELVFHQPEAVWE
jgi:Flp pilus assembly protein TadG